MYKSPNCLNELWRFLKKHIVICLLCLLSGLIIAKQSNIPAPSWLPTFFLRFLLRPEIETTAFEYLEILNNLSLAFIASIITYIVIQYIPERKKAYKSYEILKNELRGLYEHMDFLISIYLFDLGLKKNKKRISLKSLSNLPHLTISDRKISCAIDVLFDGEKGNILDYGYSLLTDSIRYVDAIKKNIEHIEGAMCSAQLDEDIINIVSTIENGLFVRCFHNSNIVKMRNRNPDIQHHIMNLDKGLYEIIRCHRLLDKYNFEKVTFQITKISDEEMREEEEKILFMNNRIIFRSLGANRVNQVVDSILLLDPTEERLQKSQDVLLEILVYYDEMHLKSQEVLAAALKLSEYIMEHDSNAQNYQYAILNYLQTKKRFNCLSDEDTETIQRIISDKKSPEEIVLGALIINEDYEKALRLFEQLPGEEKDRFIQFPIYNLWPNPPVNSGVSSSLFTRF